MLKISLPKNDFWSRFKTTHGALSCAEALVLFSLARQSPNGTYLELGSNRGKSSQCIAAAIAEKGERATFVAVEPEFSDEDWRLGFVKIIDEVIGGSRYTYLADFSMNVLPTYESLSFCFVDSGNHSDELVMNETKLLEDKMISGGIIAYHDCFSQFTKVTEAYEYILNTGKYEPITIDWNTVFEKLNEIGVSEERNNSWHLYPELNHSPNFIGAVVKK